MGKRLENAMNLYMEGIRDGKVREAVTKYTGARYTQHSTESRTASKALSHFSSHFWQEHLSGTSALSAPLSMVNMYLCTPISR